MSNVTQIDNSTLAKFSSTILTLRSYLISYLIKLSWRWILEWESKIIVNNILHSLHFTSKPFYILSFRWLCMAFDYIYFIFLLIYLLTHNTPSLKWLPCACAISTFAFNCHTSSLHSSPAAKDFSPNSFALWYFSSSK